MKPTWSQNTEPMQTTEVLKREKSSANLNFTKSYLILNLDISVMGGKFLPRIWQLSSHSSIVAHCEH